MGLADGLIAGVQWNAISLGLYSTTEIWLVQGGIKALPFEGVELPSASNKNLLHLSVRFTILYRSRVNIG